MQIHAREVTLKLGGIEVLRERIPWVLGAKDFFKSYIASPHLFLNPEECGIEMAYLTNAKTAGHANGRRRIRSETEAKVNPKIMGDAAESDALTQSFGDPRQLRLARGQGDCGLGRGPVPDAVPAPHGYATARGAARSPATGKVGIDAQCQIACHVLPWKMVHEPRDLLEVPYQPLQLGQALCGRDCEVSTQLLGAVGDIRSVLRQVITPGAKSSEHCGSLGS